MGDDQAPLTIDEKAYVDCEEKFFSGVGLENQDLGTSAYLNKNKAE